MEIKEVEVERIVYQKEIQYVDKIVEKPVERIVYQEIEKIVEKIIEKPVIIEKIVDRPVYREKIVDDTADTIMLSKTEYDLLASGDSVTYSKGVGGTMVDGLVDERQYYVITN